MTKLQGELTPREASEQYSDLIKAHKASVGPRQNAETKAVAKEQQFLEDKERTDFFLEIQKEIDNALELPEEQRPQSAERIATQLLEKGFAFEIRLGVYNDYIERHPGLNISSPIDLRRDGETSEKMKDTWFLQGGEYAGGLGFPTLGAALRVTHGFENGPPPTDDAIDEIVSEVKKVASLANVDIGDIDQYALVMKELASPHLQEKPILTDRAVVAVSEALASFPTFDEDHAISGEDYIEDQRSQVATLLDKAHKARYKEEDSLTAARRHAERYMGKLHDAALGEAALDGVQINRNDAVKISKE